MQPDRRSVLGGLAAALVAPGAVRAGSVADGAGRAVRVPPRMTRIFPAGPPAAITLYTVAPDLLIGWPRANRADEREFLHPEIGARPEVGRITGRGNTANLEVVLALKPDLILDVGTVSNTYISLADRVQQQTGIPYALLDGRFAGIPESYRIIGALTGRRDEAVARARYAEDTLKTITALLGGGYLLLIRHTRAHAGAGRDSAWHPDRGDRHAVLHLAARRHAEELVVTYSSVPDAAQHEALARSLTRYGEMMCCSSGTVTNSEIRIRCGPGSAEGSTRDVLTRERLEALDGAPVETLRDPSTGQIAFLPG